jgi:hypothetical protein
VVVVMNSLRLLFGAGKKVERIGESTRRFRFYPA